MFSNSLRWSQIFVFTITVLRPGWCIDTDCKRSGTDEGQDCESGWSLVDRQCVKVFTERQNWTEAVSTCMNESASILRYDEEKYSCIKDDIPTKIEAVWMDRMDKEQNLCFVVRLNETEREKALDCSKLRLFVCSKNAPSKGGLQLEENVKDEEIERTEKEGIPLWVILAVVGCVLGVIVVVTVISLVVWKLKGKRGSLKTGLIDAGPDNEGFRHKDTAGNDETEEHEVVSENLGTDCMKSEVLET